MKIYTIPLLIFCFINTKSSAIQDTLPVSFQSEKYKLNGKVIAPKDRSFKMPVIIFLVGSGGNSSYSTNYADFLNFFLEQPLTNQKIALMYFDKRGVGQSEGVWYKTDFEQRAIDAKNAAAYLKTLPFIDAEQIFLVGHSQGGWIVQMCLAQYPDVFAGGISMAGATFGVKKQLINDYQSTFICSNHLPKEKAYEKAKKKVNNVLALTAIFPLKQNWKQLKHIRKFEIARYLPKIIDPFLFMWGENDRLVSPEWCIEELHKNFSNGIPNNFETYIAKGENHSFKIASVCYDGKSKDIAYSEASRTKMIKWLLNNLKKS